MGASLCGGSFAIRACGLNGLYGKRRWGGRCGWWKERGAVLTGGWDVVRPIGIGRSVLFFNFLFFAVWIMRLC